MKIKVFLFAGLRERAGQVQVELDLEPGVRARDIPGRVFGPSMAEPPRSLRYAVNEEYVLAGTLLRENDEVALIPPVAGG
jgi:molybdopterin synthase catalytic subunit